MNSYQSFFFGFFIVAVLGCFSPIKPLAYILPFVFIVLGQFSHNNVLRLLGAVAIAIGYFIIYKWLYGNQFLAQNFILSLLTYGSLFTCFFVNFRKLYSPHLERKLVAFLATVVTVQAIWGIVQALYGFSKTRSFDVSNGDYVEGTIAPGLSAELSFSNVMFVTNMLLITNFLFSHYLRNKRRSKIPVYLALFVVILASVVHSILIYLVSLVIAFLLIRPRLFRVSQAGGRKILLAVLLIVASAGVLLKDNISHIPDAVSKISSPELPRAIATYRVFTELPADAPLQPYIGLGLGQFCSRASLINSGLYLGGPSNPKTLPLFRIQRNRLADKYVFSLIEEWAHVSYLGSSNQPYYSFLSVYTETGLVGMILLLVMILLFLLKVRRLATGNPSVSTDAFLLVAGVLYVFFLGIQENYYEVAQAIFVGILLLQFMYAKLRYAAKTDTLLQETR